MNLEPCPFCGNIEVDEYAFRFEHLKGKCRVVCEACCCCGPWVEGVELEELASVAWNTRHSPWQPIETAPKDNGESDFLIMDFDEIVHSNCYWDTDEVCFCSSVDNGRLVYIVRNAKLWMPRPEPPK